MSSSPHHHSTAFKGTSTLASSHIPCPGPPGIPLPHLPMQGAGYIRHMLYFQLQLPRFFCVLVLQHSFRGDHFFQDQGLPVVGYLETENIPILRWDQKGKSGLVVTYTMLLLRAATAASQHQHSLATLFPRPTIQIVVFRSGITATAPCLPPRSQSQVWRRSRSPLYLVHISVGHRRSANQLVLLLEELSQLEVESCLDALDGIFVLWPLATAFHVADHWGQTDSRRPVSPTLK